MDEYKFILNDDSIDLAVLNTNDKTLFEKETAERKEVLLNTIKEDYISFLRENYDADEKLFDMMGELIEESEDQEKLLKILDSL
jgi:predicted adenine nucleotide alpha hydrolase (AANH) superfamily ATPase